MIKKYHSHKLQTNPWHHEEEPHTNHQEDKLSKATSSLFPIKIAKLEWTYYNVQQKHRTFTDSHNGTKNKQPVNNNRTTNLEWTAALATGGLNAFYWYQIFVLDSAVVEL